MTLLRRWAQKVYRQEMVARQNDEYGIPARRFVSRESKAARVDRPALDRVGEIHPPMSLQLQQACGLPREGAIKLQPSYADCGDGLVLKDSWTKGGKTCDIPVRTPAWRELME